MDLTGYRQRATTEPQGDCDDAAMARSFDRPRWPARAGRSLAFGRYGRMDHRDRIQIRPQRQGERVRHPAGPRMLGGWTIRSKEYPRREAGRAGGRRLRATPRHAAWCKPG